MQRVGHRIRVGESTYDSTDGSRLVALRVHAALGVPVNSAWIALAPPSGIAAEPGDPVVVQLGYGDALSTVFTGAVDSVDGGIGQVVFQASGSSSALVTARANRFFEKSTAGDIVSDLAGLLGVPTGKVEPGPQLTAYALGEGRSVYDGLLRLAERCGFDLYADAEDLLVFAPYAPVATHAFRYGADILSLRVERPADPVSRVEVYGESPASLGQGPEASPWLTKKDVKGTAGEDGGLVLRRFDPAVRTQEDAQQVAHAGLALARRRRACTLKALGAPKVRLGDAIEISAMPEADRNGTFKVVGILHRLDLERGFVSTLDGCDQ